MHFSRSSLALFTLISSAVAKTGCVAEHGESLASFSNCGDRDGLIYCLSQLPSDDESDLTDCYTFSGCSNEEAKIEASFTVKRCRRLSMLSELKRRADSSSTTEEDSSTTTSTTSTSTTAEETTSTTSSSSSTSTTTSSTDTATTDATTADTVTTTDSSSTDTASTSSSSSSGTVSSTSTSATTGIMSGTMCFTTGTSSTTACSTWTSVSVEFKSCHSTYVSTVDCAPNYVCTTNSDSGDDICMQMKGIETGGVVVAIVFAAIAFFFFVGVFWASHMSSKKQKIAAEKAEALALKRSATLKKMPMTK